MWDVRLDLPQKCISWPDPSITVVYPTAIIIINPKDISPAASAIAVFKAVVVSFRRTLWFTWPGRKWNVTTFSLEFVCLWLPLMLLLWHPCAVDEAIIWFHVQNIPSNLKTLRIPTRRRENTWNTIFYLVDGMQILQFHWHAHDAFCVRVDAKRPLCAHPPIWTGACRKRKMFRRNVQTSRTFVCSSILEDVELKTFHICDAMLASSNRREGDSTFPKTRIHNQSMLQQEMV